MTAGIAHGVAHLVAEDEQLGGRFVTLHNRRQVNFGSCSYVGLETDLRLKASAIDAVSRYGVQFASSRAYVSCPPYAELERLLGALFDAPLVVAQTTTLAHLAALPILVGKDDAVVCDQMVHNSVQAVLPTLAAAGTTCRFVRHNRIDRLDQLVGVLAASTPGSGTSPTASTACTATSPPWTSCASWRRVTTGSGCTSTTPTASAGRAGTGAARSWETAGSPPRTVMVASLAKAFSAGGAVIVTPDAETARFIRTCGSTLIFSGPLQPALLGAAIASARVHLSPEIHERQRRLKDRILRFNALADARGLPLGSRDVTPIRFVRTGDSDTTFRMAADLMRDGFYVNTAVFPAVTQGQGGLRIALTVHQTQDDIRDLVDAIARRI